MKTALITGVTGQDGSFLAELLLEKGYEVHGMARRLSSERRDRIEHLRDMPRFYLHDGDMTNSLSIIAVLQQARPDEIYNLAAQSHVMVSFETPEYTANTDGTGLLRVLEAVRLLGMEKHCRIYQASTSELYGKVQTVPQNELTPFYPRSPYAVAKLYSYWITTNYREAYGMFATNGILFNHESPRRGGTFVTRKITRAVAAINAGKQDELWLGNLDAIRDWGYAPEYVEGMWRMLQADEPGDFVLATGVGYSVRDFLASAFDAVGLNWENYVRFDPRYLRPAEVDALIGDASKAERELGWKATVYGSELARLMVENDVRELETAGTPFIDTVQLASWGTK